MITLKIQNFHDKFKFLNSWHIKLIAIITMTIDHIGLLWDIHFFRIIGRIALPLFVFLIAFGFHKTKNHYKYLIRLSTMAVIIHVFDKLFYGYTNFNIFVTLTLGLISLILHKKNILLSLLYLLLLYLMIEQNFLSTMLYNNIEYGFHAILMIYFFGINFNLGLLYLFISPFFVTNLYNSYKFDSINYYQVISAFLLLFFDKNTIVQQSNLKRNILYFYFPLHIGVLYVIKLITFKLFNI